MKNFVFVFFILFNFYFLVKTHNNDAVELNYFVYFVRDSNVIVCLDKEEENIKFELQSNNTDNRFNCLIDLKRDGLYKINLNMKEVNFNSRLNFYEEMNGNDGNHLNVMNLKIGENIVLGNIKYNPYLMKAFEIILRLENGFLSYSNSQLCNDFTDIETCKFFKLFFTDSPHIKLDFDFPSNFEPNTVLLEKQAKANTNSCNPPCVNGICYNSSCFCKNGYMGANCSVSTAPTDVRVTAPILIVLFVVAALLGVFISFLIFWLCLCICKNDTKEGSKEVDIIEHWGQDKA